MIVLIVAFSVLSFVTSVFALMQAGHHAWQEERQRYLLSKEPH